jgi:hypothetical protein
MVTIKRLRSPVTLGYVLELAVTKLRAARRRLREAFSRTDGDADG